MCCLAPFARVVVVCCVGAVGVVVVVVAVDGVELVRPVPDVWLWAKLTKKNFLIDKLTNAVHFVLQNEYKVITIFLNFE